MALGDNPSLPLAASGDSRLPWLVAASLQLLLFSHSLFPICVCVSNPPLFSLLRTPVIGFRATPNPRRSHLDVLTLITSVQTLLK